MPVNNKDSTELDAQLGYTNILEQKLYTYLAEAFPDKNFDPEQFSQWMDTRKEFMDLAMRAIQDELAQREQAAELRGRIDENKHWLENEPPYGKWLEYLESRITELEPYCEHSFGQFECGEPVARWGERCEKHS